MRTALRGTEPDPRRGTPTRGPRAWWVLALLPLSLVAAFAVGEGVVSALGYPVGGSDPVWVSVVADLVTVAVAVAPCAVAAPLARREHRAGERGSLVVFWLAVVLGAALIVITLVSLIGDLTR